VIVLSLQVQTVAGQRNAATREQMAAQAQQAEQRRSEIEQMHQNVCAAWQENAQACCSAIGANVSGSPQV
jgi:FtsZ-binding cell division protein ZapB